METEKNSKLHFLNVLVSNKLNLTTSIYRKPKYSSYLTFFFSFTPSKYKNGLIKTLLDRCYKINNTWIGFDKDLENLTKIWNKNQLLTKLINKVIKKYLNLKLHKRPLENNTEKKTDIIFFKLPYIGKYSKIEDLQKDAKSKTFKYLQESRACNSVCNKDCFSVIGRATTEYQLKIKEVMHIKWIPPKLNKHVKHYTLSLID